MTENILVKMLTLSKFFFTKKKLNNGKKDIINV